MSTPSLFMRPRSFLSICWCEVSIFISTRVFPATAYQNFTLTLIIGGSEQATPAQARVMIVVLSPWAQLTKTGGRGYSQVPGPPIRFAILPTPLKFFQSALCFHRQGSVHFLPFPPEEITGGELLDDLAQRFPFLWQEQHVEGHLLQILHVLEKNTLGQQFVLNSS